MKVITTIAATTLGCFYASLVHAEANTTIDASNSTDVPSSTDTSAADFFVQALKPPTSLLEATDAMTKLCPPKYLDAASVKNRAIPTNNWWGNIIAHDKSATIQPIWSNPYAIQVVADLAPFGFAISYPYRNRVSGGSSGNGGALRYYAHGIVREFMFSASEFSAKPSFQIVDWADMGVKVRMKNGNGQMESDFTSGAAYVTMKYDKLTPKLLSVAAISKLNGQSVTSGKKVTGSKIVIEYNSGQKWILYALGEAPITLTVENGSTLQATAPFTGTLRVALAATENAEAQLDQYKSCIAEGASLEILDDSNYAYRWKTSGNCDKGLLHYALQHHADSIDAASARPVDGMATYSATRGRLQAYVTSSGSAPVWKLQEKQVVAESLYPMRKVSPQVVKEQRILEHLRNDITRQEWSIPVGGSYYFNGKAAQKYASLCLMANDRAVVGDDMSLLQTCLSKLRKVMVPFITNGWKHPLQYDRIYGGIVSSEGFHKNDMNADFGNTMYNDHHFHYGYWIHTAAIINTLDPTWSDLPKLNELVNLLVRDVANYETSEESFPRFRSFDWFRGHSYSHGVTPFADGKDQESTSEDMNFAFGMYMYGKATKNVRMETVGKLMTRVNAHAIKTYFLLENHNQIHPVNFRPNKVTGIFFDNKVDYATWFSAEKHCIHGIQMLPMIPMTELVRTKTFVQEEWDQVLSKDKIVVNQDTTNGWLSILYANYAMVDKSKAFGVLQKTKMDDGLTRSWALYMAASLSNNN